MYYYCVTERQMESRSLHGCLFLGPSLYSPRPCQRTVWRGSFAPPCGHFASLVRSFATLIARVPFETLRVSAALRVAVLSGIPPYKAAFVSAPCQWGFARHGRGLRRVRGGSCAPNAMPPFRASLESAFLPPPAELSALAGCETQVAEAATRGGASTDGGARQAPPGRLRGA